MKKFFSTLLILFILLSLVPMPASAQSANISEFELPKPTAPVYLMFDAADRTATEGDDALYVIRRTDMSVLQLSSEYYLDSEAFYKKYGLYSFCLIMQFDTSLDGTDNWNYTPEWDKEYSAPGTGEAAGIFWIGEDMMNKETVFDLYACEPGGDAYGKIADAIIQRDATDGNNIFNNFYFDSENHSLNIRCRYYMEWETYDGQNIGEKQSKFSEWSDIAVFGKGGNSITPDAPTGYEAPVISDLKYIAPGEGDELGYLTYIQSTPEQVWNAGIYYEMTESGSFEGLETEISINGGEWLPYNTVDAWGDWCLVNGSRTAYLEEPRIEADSQIMLRVRFLGTHGPSEWSNIIELNGGGTNEVTEGTGGSGENGKPDDQTDETSKCGICGFCPVPLGLCIFIWIAIVLIIIILVIIVICVKRPKKCKNCGEKLEKDMKHCPKCGSKTE